MDTDASIEGWNGCAREGWDGCIREGWGLIEGAGYAVEGWHYRPKNDD